MSVQNLAAYEKQYLTLFLSQYSHKCSTCKNDLSNYDIVPPLRVTSNNNRLAFYQFTCHTCGKTTNISVDIFDKWLVDNILTSEVRWNKDKPRYCHEKCKGLSKHNSFCATFLEPIFIDEYVNKPERCKQCVKNPIAP